MPSDRSKIEYAKSYLRRKYATDLPGLKALADAIFASATESVEITSLGFEGGSSAGVVVFEKAVQGIAIEELIAEFSLVVGDPVMSGRGLFSDFSRGILQT